MFAPITLRVHIVAIGIEVFVVVPKSYLGDPFVEFITLYTKNAIAKRCKVRDYRHYPCTRLVEVVLFVKTRSYSCFPTVVVMFPIYIKGVSSILRAGMRVLSIRRRLNSWRISFWKAYCAVSLPPKGK